MVYLGEIKSIAHGIPHVYGGLFYIQILHYRCFISMTKAKIVAYSMNKNALKH